MDRAEPSPAPGSAGLRMEDVSAGYGTAPILLDVSLRVAPGAIVGLIGPNGSGKTTLIRVASRGLAPRSGRVLLGGVDPYSVPARHAARLVAVVPQDLQPAFGYTVLEMVLMGRSPYASRWGGGDVEGWVHTRRAMGAANVQHLADRQLDELSGGERQRVILGQALAQRAPVLLLDEPTTHLDVRHVVDVLGVVRGLARGEGTAVLAIFHDLNLASAYCDRIYAMQEGRIVASGPPDRVITRGLVRRLFDVDAEVVPVGAGGRPSVAVLPPVAADRDGPAVGRAHVIGGAGRGAAILRLLAERGFEVSTGVLHGGDTDEIVAERLGILRITVPPFSPIDPRSAADCAEMIRGAAVLVVCDVPFGPGNVENLRLAVAAARAGVRTIVLAQVPIEERDFTAGVATELWRALEASAVVARSVGEVMAAATRQVAEGLS